MAAQGLLKQIHRGDLLPDPGASGTITVDRSPCYVDLVSATAETRTLARPTRSGAFVTLNIKTDGGDITLTVTGGYNEIGDTTLVFSDAGQFAVFVACYDGTDYYWRLVSHWGLGNQSPTEATQFELAFAIQPNATVTEYDIWVAPFACEVTGIRYVPSTLQGGAMTATVCKATGTNAPANGTTPMHTANAINLNSNAYTQVAVTLTSTAADLVLAAGDRIGIDYSAAPTAAFWALALTLKRL